MAAEKNCALSAEKIQDMETLLLLFPASELVAFYKEHSQQMLLNTNAQIESHHALLKLLDILAKN